MNPNSKDGKVTLWTQQDIRSLDELKKNGTIRIQKHHLEEKFELISGYVINLYSWFIQQAEKRVPRPPGVEFPVWCSVSQENMLRPTEDTVVYVLEVDESEIIYFDGYKWDHVLNHIYIPVDEADQIAYEKEMKKLGHENLYGFFEEGKAHFYPRERKRISDSWIRVFDIDGWNIFRVQANIWEVRQDMVKDILYYKENQA